MYRILKKRQLSDQIWLMDVLAPRTAHSCMPGQFVIVKIDEAGERIPLTICDYDREAGTVTIVFQPIGVSTQKFARLQAGDAFLSYPNTTIHYFADAQEPWEYVWVGFSGLDAAGYMEQTDFSPDNPVFLGRDSEQLRQLITGIYDHYGTSVWEGLEMTSRLYALLAFLIRTSQRRQDQRREVLDCARLAADYIITHYEEPITVEGLAAYASVSHSSLYRRFVKRFQMSPKRFLLEYRIERACALLATTNCSIQEISNSVGFEDPFYFSRAFKEIKGVSPRQYANNLRREAEESR